MGCQGFTDLMHYVFVVQFFVQFSIANGMKYEDEGPLEEYCQSEIFHPRCLKNEVILMKSAAYGRMRIGRCITSKEIDAIGPRFGQDPTYLGCAADILPLLNDKCSGKTECDVRVVEISEESITNPCFPGLRFYLEASYECIGIADERHSCSVDVISSPVHVIGSKTCGTKSHPWILEAPVGQKIRISLLYFFPSKSVQSESNIKKNCPVYDLGQIVDKVAKRNFSICAVGGEPEEKLYLSSGNVIDIYLNSSGRIDQFILKFEAVGCSDIIPPEDAFLKRTDETIVVGCYVSRKSWHLHCEDGNWIGVIGNCSQSSAVLELNSNEDPTTQHFSRPNDQVLVMMALGGSTLAICLAVICFGIVFVRRLHTKREMKQEYKTLNCQHSALRTQPLDHGIHHSIASNFMANGVQAASSESLQL